MSSRAFNLLTGRSNWNILLFALAAAALIGSFSALAYTTLNKRSTDTFEVYGKEYDWDTLYVEFDLIDVQDVEGVPLEDLIRDAGVDDPEDHEYRIIAADGYLKTVSWKDMETGVISLEGTSEHDKMVVFEDKAKAYWVFDVVEIEVV